MSESEERNKRLMAEAEQIETESREVAEEAWAEVDPRAVQLASDIRSVVEENRRLREALVLAAVEVRTLGHASAPGGMPRALRERVQEWLSLAGKASK